MPIITISRWCCSKGQEIAERLAERLGYRCISRRVLLEASEEFNIPEFLLERALHDAPSLLNRFTHGRERFVAFIRQAFLEQVIDDNVVYHGLAGHFFVEGVWHVFKVRIFADLEERIKLEMGRENTSREAALKLIQQDDEERRKWSLALYGIDTADARLYDMVLYLLKIGTDEAVEIICNTVQRPQFQATPESRRVLENLLLGARAKSAIVGKWPRAEVSAEDGEVVVHVEAMLAQQQAIRKEIRNLIRSVPGVRDIQVSVRPRFGRYDPQALRK